MKVCACLLAIHHEFIAIHSLSGNLLYNMLLAEYPTVFSENHKHSHRSVEWEKWVATQMWRVSS